MWEGRQRAEWRQTAELCAVLAEPHRNEKEKADPFTYRDFYPFEEDCDEYRSETTPEDLRRAFLGW